jgi:glucose-6-phosphate isomerase
MAGGGRATLGRMVGHYWLRVPELALAAELAQAIRPTRERVDDFVARVHAGAVQPPGGGCG